jgi:hypothetical protein
VILVLSAASPAYAYVDPGSISVLLQIAGAVLIGGILALWHRIKIAAQQLVMKVRGKSGVREDTEKR